MPLLAISPHFRTFLAVPFLAAILAFPANAETNPNGAPPEAQSNSASPDSGAGTAPPAAAQEPNGGETPDAATAPVDTGQEYFSTPSTNTVISWLDLSMLMSTVVLGWLGAGAVAASGV